MDGVRRWTSDATLASSGLEPTPRAFCIGKANIAADCASLSLSVRSTFPRRLARPSKSNDGESDINTVGLNVDQDSMT